LKIGQERAALDLERSRLNLEEVRHSGVSPRNELYAPFVGGRDFVSERLAVETREIELDIRLLAEHLERLKDLREKALVRAEEPDALEKEIVSRRARIDEIGQRLELRKRFLDGKVSARAVEIEGRLAVAEANLRSAQSKVDVLAARMIRLQALQAEGMVSPTETVGMQYALDSARAELKLAALEVDILKKAL
jgi:multidrug resistance efflux pump